MLKSDRRDAAFAAPNVQAEGALISPRHPRLPTFTEAYYRSPHSPSDVVRGDLAKAGRPISCVRRCSCCHRCAGLPR